MEIPGSGRGVGTSYWRHGLCRGWAAEKSHMPLQTRCIVWYYKENAAEKSHSTSPGSRSNLLILEAYQIRNIDRHLLEIIPFNTNIWGSIEIIINQCISANISISFNGWIKLKRFSSDFVCLNRLEPSSIDSCYRCNFTNHPGIQLSIGAHGRGGSL